MKQGIITAAYENGISVAPKDITAKTIVVRQTGAQEMQVQIDARTLYVERNANSAAQELCCLMAKDLSQTMDASY